MTGNKWLQSHKTEEAEIYDSTFHRSSAKHGFIMVQGLYKGPCLPLQDSLATILMSQTIV